MDTLKNIGIVFVSCLAAVSVAAWFAPQKMTEVTVEVPGINALVAAVANMSEPRGESFGAVAGPDIMSPFLNWGNIRTWNRGASLLTGTSTICSIPTPAATSTLVGFPSLRIDSGNPYALQYEIGLATNNGATTTSLGKMVIAANTKSQVIATTTGTAITDTVVGPNNYINFRVGTSTPGADLVLVGKCSAVFREI